MPGFEAFGIEILAFIALIMIAAGFVQGALGLGFPMVATPLIALVTDIRTAVIIVLLPCLATVLVSLLRSPGLKSALAEFWMMPFYMLIGAAVGTRIFIAFPEFPYAFLIAALIFSYLNLDRLGRTDWRLVRSHRNVFAAIFGVLGGLSEGTANVAAPPLIVYYLALKLQPTTFVQALNICFFTGKSTQFATLATAGGVSAAQWLTTLPLAAVAASGALYGVHVRNRIDAHAYRRWLVRALLAMALVLCAQYVYQR
ncbi:MAG: sulfite exporter TauE/SafE family protein [Burkholderiales bacterium]